MKLFLENIGLSLRATPLITDVADSGSLPQRRLDREKPKGETIDYDTLIKSRPASPPKRSRSSASP